MNKVGNVGKSFALCASVATFMHGSAEKIYKSHILRTATITRTSSTRSLTHVGRKTSTQNLSKRRLRSGARSLRSVRSCGMIVWDHQHFTRSLGSRSLSSCVTLCYAKTVRGSRGHVCAAPAVQNLTFTSHSLPHGITHLRCARPGETTITSSRLNQPMPRKAAQLNHIDRCDRTLHTLPATPSPPPRSLENYFVEKYLKRM